MDVRTFGLAVVVAGALVMLAGALILTGALGWVGRLPGDIRIESGNTRVYVPITTMLIVSVALTLLSWVLRRFL